MSLQNLQLTPARLGKFKAETIKHAIPVEVLGITGAQKKVPPNNSDTYVARRWLPYGATTTNNNTINRWVVDANAHLAQEGVTPPADTLTPMDVTVVMQQYMVLYAFTDKTFDMYEDDIPSEMKKQVGERLGLVREIVRYNSLKASTNVFYGGTGTSRSTVNGTITLPLMRRVAKNLLANHAMQITEVLAPSQNFATNAVEAAFLVFTSVDGESDIRDLPKFTPVSEYGSRKVVHPNEVGSCERFRFVVSPELSSYADAGAAIGALGLVSTSGANIDVYPYIMVAEDAWSQVMLRGKESMDMIWLPPGQKDKNDPGGQRGYAGAKNYFACLLENQGWMAVVEAGVTNI